MLNRKLIGKKGWKIVQGVDIYDFQRVNQEKDKKTNMEINQLRYL